MVLPRRRLLQIGLSAGVSSMAGLPAAALAHGRHHHVGRHGGAHHGRAGAHEHAALAPASFHPEARPLPLGDAPRRLRLHNLHTDEKLDAVYFERGAYVPDALKAVNHVLRDFRTGDVHAMDPKLLDLVAALTARTESTSPVHIISGYRSPRTNAFLRAEGGAETGVAKQSLHMDGEAIDLRLADVALANLRRAALSLQAGGVGYYPVSNFVHVDVGRVRQWGGV